MYCMTALASLQVVDDRHKTWLGHNKSILPPTIFQSEQLSFFKRYSAVGKHTFQGRVKRQVHVWPYADDMNRYYEPITLPAYNMYISKDV